MRLILGDQLSARIAALRDIDKAHDTILLAEVSAEATYVRHHKKKIAFVFAAMRAFAARLEDEGFCVRYVKLDDPLNSGSLRGEVQRALRDSNFDEVVTTEPGEHRLAADMAHWEAAIGVPVEIQHYPTVGHSFLTDGDHPFSQALTWPLMHIRYDPAVAEEAWAKILDFFARSL